MAGRNRSDLSTAPNLVNLSVSPTERKEAQPLYGSASKQEELEIGEKKIEGEEIPVPLISEANEDEDEEEVRRPRVGRRPILPTFLFCFKGRPEGLQLY